MKSLKLSLLATCFGAFSLVVGAAQDSDSPKNSFALSIGNSLTLVKISQQTCSDKGLSDILASLNSPLIASQVPLIEKFSSTSSAQDLSRNLDLFVIMVGAIELNLGTHNSEELPATILKDAATASGDKELTTMNPLDALKKYVGLITENCESVRALELAYKGRQDEFAKLKTTLESENPAFIPSCAKALEALKKQLVLKEEKCTVASLEELLRSKCAVSDTANGQEGARRNTLRRNKGNARRGTVPAISTAEDLSAPSITVTGDSNTETLDTAAE